MKKFISALMSLSIAATAMGGTFAVSTDAATNGTVDATELTFLSDGESTVTVKQGEAAKIPVAMYVTQSQGFNSIGFQLVIEKDGQTALDKDGRSNVSFEEWGKETAEALAAEQAKIAEYNQKAREQGGVEMEDLSKTDNHWIYGNYGFEFSLYDGASTDNGFVTDEMICLDSGFFTGNAVAGTPGSFGFFTPSKGLFTYTINPMSYSGDLTVMADAYAGFVLSGLTARNWRNTGTPIVTWDNTEDWIYDYVLNRFYVEVPADAEPGTYTLQYCEETYYNDTAITWQNSEATAQGIANTLRQNKLTIVVEGDDVTTTTTTTTSATTDRKSTRLNSSHT